MAHTINTTEIRFDVKIGGQDFVVDFSKMHPGWVALHLRKAAQRFVNDGLTGLAGELPSVKAAEAGRLFGMIHSGEAPQAKERKAASVTRADPVRKLARDLATTELLATLKKNAGHFGSDEKAWAVHPATAKYFKVSDKGRVTFIWDEVDSYIIRAKERENNPADFMAIAQAQIDEAGTIADDIDLDAMGI